MELFLDSANLREIEECLSLGVIKGITTNPSLMSKEPQRDFFGHLRDIADLCKQYKQEVPLSAEVFTENPHEMAIQAIGMMSAVNYHKLNVKIPMGWKNMGAIRRLVEDRIPVNCTCLFTEAQCILAANAGATYVSIFYGRLRDVHGTPTQVITGVRNLLDHDFAQLNAKIIVGSIRHTDDIATAMMAGAHIVTAGIEHLRKLADHPQTTASIQGFMKDWKEWSK